MIEQIERQIEDAQSFEELKSIQSQIYDLSEEGGKLTRSEADALTNKLKRKAEDFGVWF